MSGIFGSSSPRYVHRGTFAARPTDFALLQFGDRAIFTDIGANGYVECWADTVNSLWRLIARTVLYENTTQYVGEANTGEIIVVTYPAFPLAMLAGLTHYSISIVATKTGSAQACILGIREGSIGNITDGSAYSTSGVLTATARVGSGGLLRKYFASLGKTGLYVSSQNTALETATNSTSATYPGVQSAALSDDVYWSVTQNYAVADGTPAIERFTVIGQ